MSISYRSAGIGGNALSPRPVKCQRKAIVGGQTRNAGRGRHPERLSSSAAVLLEIHKIAPQVRKSFVGGHGIAVSNGGSIKIAAGCGSRGTGREVVRTT